MINLQERMGSIQTEKEVKEKYLPQKLNHFSYLLNLLQSFLYQQNLQSDHHLHPVLNYPLKSEENFLFV